MNQVPTDESKYSTFLRFNFSFVEDGDENKGRYADNPEEKDGMGRAYFLKKGSELRKNEPERKSSHRNDQSPCGMATSANFRPKKCHQSYERVSSR